MHVYEGLKTRDRRLELGRSICVRACVCVCVCVRVRVRVHVPQ